MEGIAAAKARGVYRGRKRSIDPAEVGRLQTLKKLGATAIALRLGIGRASVLTACSAGMGERGGEHWPSARAPRQTEAVMVNVGFLKPKPAFWIMRHGGREKGMD